MTKYEAFKRIVEIRFEHELMVDIQSRFVLAFIRNDFKDMKSIEMCLKDILISKIILDDSSANKAIVMYSFMSVILF